MDQTATQSPSSPADDNWSVYIVRCADGSLYTGIAKDVAARLQAHNAGKGAKYTRSRGPVILVHEETGFSRSDASKREYAIKQMTLKQKAVLISSERVSFR